MTGRRLDPSACPKCGSRLHLYSVESTLVHYGLAVADDGSFDYDGDNEDFAESAQNISDEPDRWMVLHCGKCHEDFDARLLAEHEDAEVVS